MRQDESATAGHLPAPPPLDEVSQLQDLLAERRRLDALIEDYKNRGIEPVRQPRDVDNPYVSPQLHAAIRSAIADIEYNLRTLQHVSTLFGELSILSRDPAGIRNTEGQQRDNTGELYFRLLLNRFAFIAQLSRTIAEALAIEGGKNGQISRKQSSERLGVHQGTVARWIKTGYDPLSIIDQIQPVDKDILLADDRKDSDSVDE